MIQFSLMVGQREREGQVRILGDFKGEESTQVENVYGGGENLISQWFVGSVATVDKRECWKIAHIFLLLCLGLGGIRGQE